jgi:hypothetical protein
MISTSNDRTPRTRRPELRSPRDAVTCGVYPVSIMKHRIPLFLPALVLTMLMAITSGAAAQVATLRTPDPAAEESAAPVEEIDGQDAVLQFVACLRDNGIDLPDPQFGADGGFFGGGDGAEALANIDFGSVEFIAAVTDCQSLLEALQPDLDAQQQAEQNEQLLAFAECMRGEGIDFPDPDPIRGLTPASMLELDAFSSEFQAASASCIETLDLELTGPPGAQ